MNRTPPSALRKTSRVCLPAWPAKPVQRSVAEHSATSSLARRPSAFRRRPMMRATVVFPVPGRPPKKKLSSISCSGSRPWRLANAIVPMKRCTCSFTAPQPISPENVLSMKPLGSARMVSRDWPPSSARKSLACSAAAATCCRLQPLSRVIILALALDSRFATAPPLPKCSSVRRWSASTLTAASAVSRSTCMSICRTLARRMARRSSSP
mmetsp:Transcript_114444/g.369810  ORF Transcript_114444/g.369810 Transcript_114444/m.369810 type:complete len:210 (-) Transcript_114444:2174-2803(-)